MTITIDLADGVRLVMEYARVAEDSGVPAHWEWEGTVMEVHVWDEGDRSWSWIPVDMTPLMESILDRSFGPGRSALQVEIDEKLGAA